MRKAVVLSVLLVSFSQTAMAGTICATVKNDIPDNYLNVRTGPGVDYSIIERIYPGDNVAFSSTRCGLDTSGTTLCAGRTSDWVFLEMKLPAAGGLSEGTTYNGWVNSIYVTDITCR